MGDNKDESKDKKDETEGCCSRFSVLSSPDTVLIFIGAMISHLIINGIARAYGVIYVELMDLFGSGPGLTSWVAFTYSLSTALLAPVSGIVNDRFNNKVVMVISAVVAAIGLIATAFCSSIHQVIFTYGLLVGSSFNFGWTASMTFINNNFPEHRLLFTGAMYCGSSIGGIGFPFLINWLSSVYSSRGAVLCMGAVCLHLAVAGMLLTVPPNKKLVYVIELDVKAEQNKDETENVEENSIAGNVNTFGEECPKKMSKTLPSFQAYTQLENSTLTKLKSCLRSLLSIRFVAICILWYGVFSGMAAIQQYLPAFAKDHGFSTTQTAILLAILNLSDLISRIILGLVGDWKRVNNIILFSSLLLLCGIITILFTFYTNHVTFYVYVVIYGLSGDSCLIFISYTVSQVIEPKNFGLAFGMIRSILGVSSMVVSAAIGYLKDYTGTYVWFLYLSGALRILGTLCYTASQTRCLFLLKKTSNI